MRQPSEDRSLYYRQVRQTLHEVIRPELTSASARDAAALLDRILAQFIVEEEGAPALSAEFGGRFRALLEPSGDDARIVSPSELRELRTAATDAVSRACASADPEERDRGARLLDVERDFLERVDGLRVGVLAETAGTVEATTPGACSVTAEALTGYLRGKLPSSPSVEVTHLEAVPGGRSKETILVTLAGTAELPDRVILRKDRPVGLLQTRSADEFAILRAVHEFGGVPVPEPFFVEQEGHGLGDGTFMVMECVPGSKAGEYFPDLAAPTRHGEEIAGQMASSLARLHALPIELLAETRLDPSSAAVSTDSLTATIDGMVERIDGLTGPDCAAVPVAHRWLLDHIDDVVLAPRLSLLQGDFGFHNMLVDGGRLTALVDWESAAIGPPAREMAAAWNAATALVPWADFVEAYTAAGGPAEDCDPRAVTYYRVLAALGGFMTSKMGGHLFRTGTKRDLLTAHSGLDSHFRCARNLARAVTEAMSQER